MRLHEQNDKLKRHYATLDIEVLSYQAKMLAQAIINFVPESIEKSDSLLKLKEVMSLANEGIMNYLEES